MHYTLTFRQYKSHFDVHSTPLFYPTFLILLPSSVTYENSGEQREDLPWIPEFAWQLANISYARSIL